MQLISAWDLIVKSWQLFSKNFTTLFKVILWLLVPTILLSLAPLLGENTTVVTITFFLMALTIVVSIWINIILIELLNKYYKNETADVEGLYKTSWSKFWPLVLVSVLVGLAVLGGTILFIIPGIIFAVWFSFANYFLILEDKRGIEALKASKKLVQGKWWSILWHWVAPTLFYGIIMMAMAGIIMIILSFFMDMKSLTANLIGATISNILSVGLTPLFVAIGVILFTEMKKYKIATPPLTPEAAPEIPESAPEVSEPASEENIES